MKTIIALIAMTMPVNASGIDLLPFYDAPKIERVSHVPTKKVKPKKRKPVARKAAPQDDGTRVAAARYDTEQVVRCIAPVRVVGSQDVREGAAEESAKKSWMEAVRWQSGESYQDIDNARDYQKRCARSSIGEALGQFFNRCEIIATPCRPGMVKGGTP